MGKQNKIDECPQQFKCPQREQETHLAEIQTVLKCHPMATKQKQIILMVEDKIKSVLSIHVNILDKKHCNYDNLTDKPKDNDDLSTKFIVETLTTLDN
jgi:hypothetical protein